MTGRFERKLQSATPAIAGASFGLLSASFANRIKPLGNSRDACAMNVLVACPANGYPVGNIVSKFGVIAPGLDVMGLDIVGCSTLLTGAIVAAINGVSPLAVLAGIAFLVYVLFALGCVSAILATVFHPKMPIGRKEVFSAPLTDKRLTLTKAGGVLTCAWTGTGFPTKVYPPFEGFSANYACPAVALGAVIRAWVMNGKKLAAFFTVTSECEGLSVHTHNYTTFRLERWHVMTGKQPELLTP